MGKKSLFATTTPDTAAPEGPPPTESQPTAAPRVESADGTASVTPPRGTPPKRDLKNPLGITAICVGCLMLMVTIASMINNNHYFIKEKNGAVEIWKGDFTPAGKNRLIILHGTEWTGPLKNVYTRDEALGFARNVYLEKAQAILDDPGPPDDERIADYLTRALALLPETVRANNRDRMDQIDRYLKEAAILNDSEDELAVELARKKLETVQHAVVALLVPAEAAPEIGKTATNPQAHQE